MKAESALARCLLDETRDEITRVDAKASILLAGAAALNAVVLASALSDGKRVSRLSNSIEWIAWLGEAWLVGATACLLAVIWPHLTPPRSTHPQYFADFATFGSAERLREELAATDPTLRDIEQLRVLSAAVTRKYRWLKRALLGLTIGGAAICVVAVLRELGA